MKKYKCIFCGSEKLVVLYTRQTVPMDHLVKDSLLGWCLSPEPVLYPYSVKCCGNCGREYGPVESLEILKQFLTKDGSLK